MNINIKILIVFVSIITIIFANTVNVIINNLPEKVLLESEGLAIHYVNENRSFDDMSKTLTNHLNTEYQYQMQCVIAKQPLALNIHFESTVKMHFIYADINFVFFETNQVKY